MALPHKTTSLPTSFVFEDLTPLAAFPSASYSLPSFNNLTNKLTGCKSPTPEYGRESYNEAFYAAPTLEEVRNEVKYMNESNCLLKN